MLTTAIIAFREFLEAFLVIGIFIGIEKKLCLHKQKEIVLAAALGITFSLILPIVVFFFGPDATHILSERNTNALEGYLLTFSGFFIAYVVFTLHEFMEHGKKKTIANAREKMEQKIFDVSLFFTIVFFILREGFETSLLIAATSLFSVFLTNVEGLFLGFFAASLIGLLSFFTYSKLPIKKIFTYTEYSILLIGAAMVKNGITLLFENYSHINLSTMLPFPLYFLPENESIFGNEFSLIQLSIMALYIVVIVLFSRRQNKVI